MVSNRKITFAKAIAIGCLTTGLLLHSALALESELPKLATWPQIAKALAVDSAVDKKVDELLYAYEKSLIDLKTELRKQRLELARAMQATTVEEAKIMSLAEGLGRIEMRLRKVQLGLWLELKRALTADQFEKLKTWLGARHQER